MRRILSHRLRPSDEEGFTLIELMVVVLIIAILIAIAIPTFLGARQRAQDRATQADLRNALTAQKTFYTDGEAFADNSAVGSIALREHRAEDRVDDETHVEHGRADEQRAVSRTDVRFGNDVRSG
jgi:prepilin-type N-terminal cleavage/methylation domain-containing protein